LLPAHRAGQVKRQALQDLEGDGRVADLVEAVQVAADDIPELQERRELDLARGDIVRHRTGEAPRARVLLEKVDRAGQGGRDAGPVDLPAHRRIGTPG